MTPIELKLAEAAVSRGENLLAELDCTGLGTPLHWMLRRSKAAAAEALVALIHTDPTNTEDIRCLQNEAQRYGDLLQFLRETIAEATDAHQALSMEDREEILGLLSEAAEQEEGM